MKLLRLFRNTEKSFIIISISLISLWNIFIFHRVNDIVIELPIKNVTIPRVYVDKLRRNESINIIDSNLSDRLQKTSEFIEEDNSDNLDISHIISWNNINSTIANKGYCGSQHYASTLSVNKINYLQIHDIVFQTDQQSIWIFIVNYNHTSRYFREIIYENPYLLCLYNDGTSLISHKITNCNRWGMYCSVECDVPYHLIPYILHSKLSTNISVTIINPLYLNDSIKSIPVCSKWQINKNDIWHSVGFNDYKYKVSSCSIIHPFFMEHNAAIYHKYDQSIFILRDWIEYNLGILRVEHFILYQHIIPEQESIDIQQSLIWKALYPYIQSGIVTYIPWFQEGANSHDDPWLFQFSMINSCVKRFGHTKFSKYLIMLDVDEYIIPKLDYQHLNIFNLIQLTDELSNNTKNRNYEYQVLCNLAFSCPDDMGCSNHKRFNTVFERHKCLTPNNIYKYIQKYRNKQIIYASKVKLMFVHFVDIFIDENDAQQHIKNDFHHTTNLENIICLHAKSNKLINQINNSRVDEIIEINKMIQIFNHHMKYNAITKQNAKLLPLYNDNDSYCNYDSNIVI